MQACHTVTQIVEILDGDSKKERVSTQKKNKLQVQHNYGRNCTGYLFTNNPFRLPRGSGLVKTGGSGCSTPHCYHKRQQTTT